MSLRHCTVAAGFAALLALAVGCASPQPPAPAGTSTVVPPPGTPEAAPVAPGGVIPGDTGGVTSAQAAALCADMSAQLQSWRTYTPTIGKGGLNTVVGTWAAQNGLNVIDLLAHKARIDVITSTQCPDVRQGAMSALELPDLASGLIGF